MASPNRLAQETSPYLRQHAGNPVDWYPWGDEALERAKSLDRPLFVSIGYAACHWCHVMAHESFEDEAVAALLNAHFVPIKVDREERPDLDAVYLEAVQALTGRGGWPLSVFATPDGRPFFGGTYFPPRPQPGMPSFASVLEAVERSWRERRHLVGAQADELTAVVAQRLAPPAGEEAAAGEAGEGHTAGGVGGIGTAGEGGAAREGSLPAGSVLRQGAMDRFAAIFDPEHGGIGNAPKFPQAPMLELVLRAHLAGDPRALAMLERTLASMAAGGIYDHLEGGFARYSVDGAWQVPHFEKMLYDQAQLAPLYLHAFQVTGDARWRQVATETLDYVLEELAAPDGGFAASEDADAQGEEGRFSTWTLAELVEALGAKDALRAAAAYGVTDAGNFEAGRSVLHRPPGEVLRDGELERLRTRLTAARRRRVRPGRDDKVVTEWNAMFCSALAQAALALSSDRYRTAAVAVAEFLLEHLRGDDGRWRRSYRLGRASQLAVASDYAWLVDCFTRLGEATGGARWTEEARRTAADLVRLFGAEDGGWYTTGSDAEALVVRPRETYDGVTPAAGSVAAVALARLGALLGDETLLDRARRAIAVVGAALTASPLAFPHLLLAAELIEAGPVEVVVTGKRPDLVASVGAHYLPAAVLAWGEPTGSPLFQGRAGPLAWVCCRGACLAPVGEVGPLLASLGIAEPAA